jgi:hypothetical protein
MKQITTPSSMLPEWLLEHDIRSEGLSKTDQSLHALLDEYVQLMDAIEYWGIEPSSEGGAFAQVLAGKERDIMKIVARNDAE